MVFFVFLFVCFFKYTETTSSSYNFYLNKTPFWRANEFQKCWVLGQIRINLTQSKRVLTKCNYSRVLCISKDLTVINLAMGYYRHYIYFFFPLRIIVSTQTYSDCMYCWKELFTYIKTRKYIGWGRKAFKNMPMLHLQSEYVSSDSWILAEGERDHKTENEIN